MKYDLTRPCPKCPFRTDVPPYLRRGRAEQIVTSLVRGDFACHQTTEPEESDGRCVTKDSQHCAGALIMLESSGQPSQLMRIAERLGIYDPRQLATDAPVFDDPEAFIDAQED